MEKRIVSILLLALVWSVTAFAERQTIVITESGLSYSSQMRFASSDYNDVNNLIGTYYDQGYSITSAAYTSNGWLVCMAQGTDYGRQKTNMSSSWPKEWIREMADQGFYITSLATDGFVWLVVVSENPHFSGQGYIRDEATNLKPWIQKMWDKSYRITETVYDGTYWTVVMHKSDDIQLQQWSLYHGDIKQKIKQDYWDEGYSLQSLNYGGGQYFIVGCQYFRDNDRKQSYCIGTDNISDFIDRRSTEWQQVAYVGGGIDRANDYGRSSLAITSYRNAAAPREKHLASLTWLNSESISYQKNYTLNVGVKSESKVEDVKLYVNGNLDRGISPVMNDGYDMRINRTLTLAMGTNTIKLVVTNADGESMLEREIEYIPQNNPSPSNERRIALVMGNSNYSDSDKKLKNPVNDATDLSRKLESLGFTVIRALDKTQQGMEMAINDFSNQVKNYDVALFYYAGHGMRCNGYNYLIPVDAVLADESDVKYKCVNANSVLDKMDKSNCPMKIVILDACRNNPFTRGWTRGDENPGLGSMIAPKGTFIAFSTAPGEVAQDGKDRNSPYTKALLQKLDVPNLSLMDFFQEVLIQVSEETKDRQTPWTSNSFKGKFYFNKQ